MAASQVVAESDNENQIVNKMAEMATGLSRALLEHGRAVNARTVIAGLHAIGELQWAADEAERRSDDAFLSFEQWVGVTTRASQGLNQAVAELRRWSIKTAS